MQKSISTFIAALAWFVVVAQYVLMIENRVAPIGETTLRFFSFFTILTNSLVAIYFSQRMLGKKHWPASFMNSPGVLTAITVYITVVGLVYQVVLRQIWEPTGLQKWVDEVLHSIIPILVVIFWYCYENKDQLIWKLLPGWLAYPIVYLIYVLFRGYWSNFYPYPFINVSEIGISQVLLNSVVLFIFFGILSAIFIGLGQQLQNNKRNS